MNTENSGLPVEKSSTDATTGRRHDLDALRAVAMLLGIALHGSLAYTTVGFWGVRDDHTHFGFDILNSTIHGFRMQLFFVISGFFTAMLWRKRGLVAVLRQRALRILLPLVIFIVPITWLSGKVFPIINTSETEKSRLQPSAETLWTAARDNDVEALKRHTAGGADLNQRDPQFQIPALNWAALNGSLAVAEWLLNSGAQVDVTSEDESTPLSHAAFTGRPDLASLLIKRGANVNRVNRHQSTPLNNAEADWGIVEWAAGLLKLKVDKPSVESGHLAVAALLKENGGRHQSGLGAANSSTMNSQPKYDRITQAYLDFSTAPVFSQFQFLSHLWFLWFLCLLLIPFGVYAWVAKKVNWRGASPALFQSPRLLWWLVPLTMIPQWFHGLTFPGFGPDTSTGIIPPPHILLLYFVYFFFGVCYYDVRDTEAKLCRHWWWMLPIALLAVYPLAMGMTFNSPPEWMQRWIPSDAVRPLAVLMQVIFAWFMIFGLIGLFRKFFSSENKTARYLSDSAYFLYLLHLPLLFVPQYLMKQADVPAAVKFIVVCVSTTAVLLLTYHFCIRYTLVGTMLNGKRRRPAKQNISAN